jgi:hypothetical protein
MNEELTLKFTYQTVDQLINVLNHAIKMGGYDTSQVAGPLITEIIRQVREIKKSPDQTAE